MWTLHISSRCYFYTHFLFIFMNNNFKITNQDQIIEAMIIFVVLSFFNIYRLKIIFSWIKCVHIFSTTYKHMRIDTYMYVYMDMYVSMHARLHETKPLRRFHIYVCMDVCKITCQIKFIFLQGYSKLPKANTNIKTLYIYYCILTNVTKITTLLFLKPNYFLNVKMYETTRSTGRDNYYSINGCSPYVAT